MCEPLTYADLLKNQDRLVATGELNPQTSANRATALRLFLRANHLQTCDVVGAEMRSRYPESVEQLLNKLRQEERTERNISNTRSALRPWREIVVEHDIFRAAATDKLPPFNASVKDLLNGQAVKRVARQAGVSHDLLFGWLQGKRPRASSAKFIRRLEGFFGLPVDSLVVLAGISGTTHIRPQVGIPTPVAFRAPRSSASKWQYFLRPAETSPLRMQWTDLLRYKTAPVPALERSSSGLWTVAPILVAKETKANWWNFLGDREVPTARVAWAKTGSYLGWLCLPRDEGGAGRGENEVQTLAWFAVTEHIEAYLEWVKKRCGGKRTGMTFEFLAQVIWMVRPGDGYLAQQPEMLSTLPTQFHSNDWQTMCARQHDYCQRLREAWLHEREVSRNPFDAIKDLIDMPEPLEAIADMVQRMRQDRPIGCLTAEATWARDIFLIKLLVSNPLRLRNLATLTWRADNTGNLYQRPDGSWRIKIQGKYFKNRRGFAARQDYDSPVHESVWADLERYVLFHRNRLLRASTDLVFLTKGKATEHRPWLDLGTRVREATKKYLWKSSGIKTHAFRHIVATSILKAPGGDMLTAALVLNDSQATVEKNYSWIRSGDGSVRMGELLGKTLQRM